MSGIMDIADIGIKKVVNFFTNNTPNTERKTETPEEIKSEEPKKAIEYKKITQSSETNVLNSYRSFTYNFTLSGLRAADINDETAYIKSADELVILKSGGKGPALIKGIEASASVATPTSNDDTLDRIIRREKLNKINTDLKIVEGFNENSSGRFDMFINNVEIDSLMAFTEQGGTTLPLTIKFDVYEPYSINGFFEALQVVAIASGYPSYLKATYLLKVEFIGYPDTDDITDAEIVPKSTRYFPILFTEMSVDVNERGTKYGCSAILVRDSAFGQPSLIKRPISGAGNSVATILADLAKNLNDQTIKDDNNSKAGLTARDHDQYEIIFPAVKADGTLDYNTINEIGASALSEENLRENKMFKFVPIGKSNKSGDGYRTDNKQKPTTQENSANPAASKHDPNSTGGQQIQVAEQQQLHEVISAVIRDSTYIRSRLNSDKKGLDADQFFDYFLIRTEVINKPEINLDAKRPYQIYRYVIIPHKIHVTRIPRFQSIKFDPTSLMGLSLRKYDYLYMGTNVDVLDFKLNFNNLYYEAVPPALGNNDKPNAATSAGTGNSSQVKGVQSNLKSTQASPLESPKLTKPIDIQPNNVSGSQPQLDPYYAMARTMHEAVINSKTNLLTGEITILGDPFYLVTGGITGKSGNNPTNVGAVDHLTREVLITINFKNPIDINSLEKGGTVYFDSKKLPFSGVYRVLKATSTFNDGVFKQRLEIMRVPGQILSGEVEPTKLETLDIQTPKPGDTTVADTTVSSNVGQRPSETDIVKMIGRQIPSSVGLPGSLSQLTGAFGMLSGADQTVKTTINSILNNGIGAVNSTLNVFGPINTSQLSTNLRLASSGLPNSVQSGLQTAATALVAATTVNPTNAVKAATDLISNVKKVGESISVQGSGIGEGATAYVDRVMSTEIGAASKFVSNSVNTVAALGKDAAGLLSNASAKIDSLLSNTSNDPKALASKFGINVEQLSGLSENLQSKVLGEIESLAKKIPENVDLVSASAKGLVVSLIPNSKIGNIPATAPDSVAPPAAVDTAFLSELAKSQGTQAVANAFGVSDIKNISSELVPSSSLNSIVDSVKSGIANPLSNLVSNISSVDAAQLAGKLSSVNSQLSGLTTVVQSVESNLSSVNALANNITSPVTDLSKSVTSQFGSVSDKVSPLRKLIS